MHEAGPIQHSRTTQSPTPTLRELAAILFRRSRYVISGFVFVVLATLLYALMSPRYEAQLKVLLRRGRSDQVVSAQPASLADFSRPAISEEELNSEVELLRDEALRKQVVAQCGLASPGDVVAGRSESVERAARKLAQALTVELSRSPARLATSGVLCVAEAGAARVTGFPTQADPISRPYFDGRRDGGASGSARYPAHPCSSRLFCFLDGRSRSAAAGRRL